jgi:hypothetical protein
MTHILDDLLNDSRMERLFSNDARHCALQLWVLQIKSEHSIENRLVYGRLLPYSHSSDRWSSTDDDNFHVFGQVQAQVIRLNLYVKSVHCAELLRQLSAGRTISAISEELNLGLSNQLKERFGATALAADELVYRPVAYAPLTVAERLFLLKHNYPVQLENTNRDEEQILHAILQETQTNIVVFRRVA